MDENQTETQVKQPAEDLKQTTNDLIKDSLANAKNEDKPWYERLSYYVGAIVLIVLYYLGNEYGASLIEKIGQLFQ